MEGKSGWYFALLPACIALGSCSYSYDVAATVIDGRIAFVVAPSSSHEPNCLRQIEVTADDGSYMWDEAVDDACENEFPIMYGQKLAGKPYVYGDFADLPADVRGMAAPRVAPRPLEVGISYTVLTTTGSTGYGCGRFLVKPDRTVENIGCN